MIVYPAIDLKEGQVVRLLHGDPTQKTIYSHTPREVAHRWLDAGAAWVHIVNLDGALDSTARVWSILEDIAGLGLAIQFGGGLRTTVDLTQAFNSGVRRAVLGTAAIENPALVDDLLAKHGVEAIVIALDARAGKVATHGWQTESQWTAIELGKAMRQRGVRHALHTDIQRDGGLEGVNIAATCQLAHETGLQVIASGGVRSIEDVKALAGTEVAGIILGKALYEGVIDLNEAIRLAGNI
jgi:phosphoribosylformimino-5-aminoimidazole carboxamide ribotide isomerase